MPKPYPAEFREDVVRVARKRRSHLCSDRQGLRDLRATLHNWLKQADIEDGVRPGVTAAEAAELRELKKRNRAARAGERDPAPGGRLLRQGAPPKMRYPLVLDLAADGIPVAVTCRVLGFSTQAFNKWRRNPVSQRDWDEAHLINAAIDIHDDDPAFGYRFIADELADGRLRGRASAGCGGCAPSSGIWRVFAKKKGLSQEGRAAGPRRSGRPRLHRRAAQCAVAHRHHRAPDRRGQALLLRHQGRLLQPHRRLLASTDRMTAALAVSALRNAIALRHPVGTVDNSFGPGISISIQGLRPHAEAQRTHRIDGPGRRVRRQRRHGVVLLAAAEERPRPPTLGDPRGTPPRHRHLDRTDLSPPAPPACPRTTHPGRV